MKQKLYILFIIALFPGWLFSQTENISLYNAGKIYIGENPKTETTLYINGHLMVDKESDILLKGKTILMNDFINNVTDRNVFNSSSDGIFEFQGEKAQHILGNANKSKNFIDFPNLVINNMTSVTNANRDTSAVFLASNMAISTKDLTLERGRLILESDVNKNGGTDLAHLFVHGKTNYPDDNSTRTRYNKGLIQVKLKLKDEYGNGGLIGFTPPFKKIYADYFFYNLVSRPDNGGFFGTPSRLLRTPTDTLISGKGYLVGLGVVPLELYEENMNSKWFSTEPKERFTNELYFLRDFGPSTFMSFVNKDSSLKDKYTGEVINTETVTVTIDEGLNYLGNPYTVPIDMRSFLDGTGSAEWGIDLGKEVKNYYEFLKEGGRGEYDHGDNIDDPVTYRFIANFEVVSTIGSTGDPKTMIAPMQMFRIFKKTPGKLQMKIPASIRTHGDRKFLRSSDSEFFKIENELLLEAKDIHSDHYDRLSIAFRDNASLTAEDSHDVFKSFSTIGSMNQIYTMSSDHKKMTVNIIPPSTKELKVYMSPADKKKDVLLTVKRIESLSNVNALYLLDHKTGTLTDLFADPQYSFTSSPNDKEDRFTLYFSNAPTSNELLKTNNTNVYYRDNNLTVTGLQTENMGDIVTIYDLSGRMVMQSTLRNVPTEQIPVTLAKGAYMVRFSGYSNEVMKIIIK